MVNSSINPISCFFNEQATHDNVLVGIRQIYTGPLSLAVDNMIWNISKEAIIERRVIATK